MHFEVWCVKKTNDYYIENLLLQTADMKPLCSCTWYFVSVRMNNNLDSCALLLNDWRSVRFRVYCCTVWLLKSWTNTLFGKGSELNGEIVSSLFHQCVEHEREQLYYKMKPWCSVGLWTFWQYRRENSCSLSKQTAGRMSSLMLKGSKRHEQASQWKWPETLTSHLTCREVWNPRRLKGFMSVSVYGECKGPRCKTKVCCVRNNFKQMWTFGLFYLNRKHVCNLSDLLTGKEALQCVLNAHRLIDSCHKNDCVLSKK